MADIRVKDLNEAAVPGADYYLLTDSATDGVKKVKTTNIVKPSDIGAAAASDLATVATSGSYSDLANKPTIPAAGIPAGGTTGQVLSKTSGSDYAAAWSAAGAGDMIKSSYDPNNVGADVFDSANTKFMPAGTGAVARLVRDKLRDTVSVKDFGATGDGVVVVGAVTATVGSPNVTVASAAFTSADVGKRIRVPGAAASGAELTTTIAAVVGPTSITLGANASTAIAGISKTVYYGTDDYAAIVAAQSAAVANGKGLVWPSGNYTITSALNLGVSDTSHTCSGDVSIYFMGSGNAVIFDGGATSGHLYNIKFGTRDTPFTIIGNQFCTNTVFARAVHHSGINIIGRNMTSNALSLQFAVLSEFFVKASVNDGGPWLTAPSGCLLATRRGTGTELNTDCTFYVIAEGIAGTGVQVDYTQYCGFEGTSEGNTTGGGGVYEGPKCSNNRWRHFACEENAGTDWNLNGTDSRFELCYGSALIFNATAYRQTVIGGSYDTITDVNGADHCRLENVHYITTFSLASTTASWRGLFTVISSVLTYIADRDVRPKITAPTLLNSWANIGGSLRSAGYYQTPDGMVNLCGSIQSGTVGQPAFNLPAGMRPSASLYFSAPNPAASTNSFVVQVKSNGDVVPLAGTNTGCALDSVKFLAEA